MEFNDIKAFEDRTVSLVTEANVSIATNLFSPRKSAVLQKMLRILKKKSQVFQLAFTRLYCIDCFAMTICAPLFFPKHQPFHG